MYPKSLTSRSSSNKQTAREQLSELLTNKFRNRYNINYETERDLDDTIQKEVNQLVKKESSVTERDLNDLDKHISAKVASYRGEKQYKTSSKAAQEDAQSTYSKLSHAQRSKSSDLSNTLIDVDAQIRAGNQGKVIGMTSAEWNQTVQKNYH